MRRLGLALLGMLVIGVGSAAGGPGNPAAHGYGTRYGGSPLPASVARALRPTAAELAMAAGAGGGGATVIRRIAVSGGRAMPYVGTALLLWSAVDAAVSWNKARTAPARSGNMEIDCAFGVWVGDCQGEPGDKTLPPGHPADPGKYPTYTPGPTQYQWYEPDAGGWIPSFRVQIVFEDTYRATYYPPGPNQCTTEIPGSVTGTKAQIWSRWQQYLGWIEGCGYVEPLPRLRGVRELVADVPAAASLAERVVTGQQAEIVADPNRYPLTYPAPLPGSQLEPAANRNQWENNPYADPRLDTDGDGWPDWKEAEAGTNPSDPDSRPTVDPSPGKAPPITDPDNPYYDPVKDPTHPDYDPSEDPDVDPIHDPNHPDYDPDADPAPEPLPDADGDGIPDMYDPCPFDRFNECARVGEEEPIEIPDDYAREDTQQTIADLLRDIRDQEKEPEEDEEDPGEFVAPELELDEWIPGQLTADAWDGVEARLSGRWETFAAVAGAKMAFSLGSWIPIVTLGGSSAPCEPINLTLLGVTNDIGFCASPIHGFLSTGGRLALLALVLIGFYLATARTLAWA